MTRNLPRAISVRVAGESTRVSSVPRSFSPAPRSMAGYIPPRKAKAMMMYGRIAPIR